MQIKITNTSDHFLMFPCVVKIDGIPFPDQECNLDMASIHPGQSAFLDDTVLSHPIVAAWQNDGFFAIETAAQKKDA